MTPTYMSARGADMLLATVRETRWSAADMMLLEAQVHELGYSGEYEILRGITLTDDETDVDTSVVWHSGNSGWLIDETGRSWRFAILSSET